MLRKPVWGRKGEGGLGLRGALLHLLSIDCVELSFSNGVRQISAGDRMQRREFLYHAGGFAASTTVLQRRVPLAKVEPLKQPIIDSHIHLFDPTRAGGVPWPQTSDDVLYKPALPERYEALSFALGIVGCIAVEASPLASDNDWLLGIAAKHPVVVGVIGNLIPGTSSYLSELDRLHRNPLFLGFRYGNLWGRDLAIDLAKPGFIDGLKALSQAGLVFESANPDQSLIRALLRVADRVTQLRIVVDHIPNAAVPVQRAALEEYNADLRALAQHPTVFVKLSEIPVVRDGELIQDPAFYQDRLDMIWDLFGADRVIFGSDWPNSDHVAPFAATLGIVRQYLTHKSQDAVEKYLWKNSATIYRWHPRRFGQPHL
jgi:predicted TIM-barrel fold metal-dependent hydrolase